MSRYLGVITIYKALSRNLNNFFKINKDLGENNYRLNIAEVLAGLVDINLYEKWKLEDKKKYEELNNIIFQINNNTDRYYTFDTLASDLWGYGYEAEQSDDFSLDIIEDQLKLINLCLRGQYILT